MLFQYEIANCFLFVFVEIANCLFAIRMNSTDINGEDTTSSSSEEEKEVDAGATVQVNGHDPHRDCASSSHTSQVNGINSQHDKEEQEEEGKEEGNALPTIYFSHTVEPKKVRSQLHLLLLLFNYKYILDLINCVAVEESENFLSVCSVV